MTFQHPLAWAWLALIVPIIVLYILKIRLRRVPVSTLLFWRQIYDEKQPRSLWQKLRHLLSLLLSLLFLLLLTFALTDPHFAWELLSARRIVLIVDTSSSMRATDESPDRLAAAKARLQTVLNSLRFRDEVAIVTSGTEPLVVCGLTKHRRTLQERLDQITISDGPTRLEPAVRLAKRLLGDHPHPRIMIGTDACALDRSALASDTSIAWLTVGQETSNVGITQFQVRRSLLDPLSFQILMTVTNASPDVVDCRLTVTLAGELIDVIPLHLTAGETVQRVLDKSSQEGGLLLAELEHVDSFPLDNVARAVLPTQSPIPVRLITRPNLFLEKVFEANPLVRLQVEADLSPLEAPAQSPPGQPPASTAAPALTILHRQIPAKLPPGPLFIISPESSCDLFEVGPEIQNPIVARQASDSLYMTHVRLENVLLPAARKLTIQGEVTSLVSSESGDLLYGVIRRESGPVLVLTVDLDQGDLPLRTAFPILATNALGQLTGQKDELREALSAGSVTRVARSTIPGTGEQFVLIDPAGQSSPLPGHGDELTVGPLTACGVWTVRKQTIFPESTATGPAATARQAQASQNPLVPAASGTHSDTSRETGSAEVSLPEGLSLAVNLADPVESDLRGPAELRTGTTGVVAGETAGFWPPWYQATLLVLVLMSLEWWLYHRRWVG